MNGGKEKSCRNRSSIIGVVLLLIAAISAGCKTGAERHSVPAEVEDVVNTVSDDIAAERYDKIYTEASDLWKRDSTPEQSADTFKTLRTKLGKVETRNLHSAVEQNNSGGQLAGEAYILTYETKFERGPGMETFTVIKQGGRWMLARYFVNSTELK